jgi:GxxExxY protein
MQPIPEELNRLSEAVIGAAVEVHRALGPGFLEAVYEEAFCQELTLRGIPFERQKEIPLYYKEKPIGIHRLDLLIDHKLVVELKAVEETARVHKAQVLSYVKAAKVRLGLLINFNVPQLVKGVERVAN